MADESMLRELDRLNVDIREVRRDYVTEKLFLELAARVGRLEAVINSNASDNKSWVRGVGLAAVGVVLTLIAEMIRSGSAH